MDGESGKSMEETDWLDSVCMTMTESVTDRLAWGCLREHTYIHPFNRPFYGTTQVSRYQKGKTNLDFTEARDSEWQWHQLGHMQVCTSLQTDNHAITPPLSFFTGRMPFLPPNQQRQSTEDNTLSERSGEFIPQTRWGLSKRMNSYT